MIVVDRSADAVRPKINGVSLKSIAVRNVSDSVDASQALVVELVRLGSSLPQRLAREGAHDDDVRAMLRFLYDARLAERPVVIAYRFRDAMACDFAIGCDIDAQTPYSVVYPDETPVVFYDSRTPVHCGGDVAFETIAYSVFPLVDPETADALYVSERTDRFVFGRQSEWCDVAVHLPPATSMTIVPSCIDVRHVDIERGPHSLVVRNRTSGETVDVALRVAEGDIAFLREFDAQWLDLHHPPSLKRGEWAYSIERGVFISVGDPMRFPGTTPNIVRSRMRRAVHRANEGIEELAIWPLLSADETKFAEIARIDGVWQALSPVGEDNDRGETVHLPMTTDIVCFALELESRRCVAVRPPIITEMNILISATTGDGSEVTFLIPVDDGRFTW